MTLSLWRVKTETEDNEESSRQDKYWGQCDGHRRQRAVNFSNNPQNWKGSRRLPFSSEGISTASVGTWDLQFSDNGTDFYSLSFLKKAENTVSLTCIYMNQALTQNMLSLPRFLSSFFLPPLSLLLLLSFPRTLLFFFLSCFLHMYSVFYTWSNFMPLNYSKLYQRLSLEILF